MTIFDDIWPRKIAFPYETISQGFHHQNQPHIVHRIWIYIDSVLSLFLVVMHWRNTFHVNSLWLHLWRSSRSLRPPILCLWIHLRRGRKSLVKWMFQDRHNHARSVFLNLNILFLMRKYTRRYFVHIHKRYSILFLSRYFEFLFLHLVFVTF